MGFKTISVIGGGLMGSGIAQISAQSGYNVHLIDVSQSNLDKSLGNIAKNLARVAKKKYKEDTSAADLFVKDSVSRIKFSTDMTKGVRESDLIIEAIVENLDMKHGVFKSLDEIAPAPCIFATNTSSLPIKEVAKSVTRLDRFGGLHFFNPVPVMRLLEVIRTPDTSDETFNILMKYGASVGKQTVVCRDTPGFVVNRLLVPYMLEAIRLHERGDATPSDIDIAMKLGAGHPMGPFELADYIGLDTIKFIVDGWRNMYPGNPLFQQSVKLNELVKKGKLGRKSGEGFFAYDSSGNLVK